MELRLSFALAFHVSTIPASWKVEHIQKQTVIGTLVSGHPRLMRPFRAICPLLADCDSLFLQRSASAVPLTLNVALARKKLHAKIS
jgi:hypothetical protein